jgi:hypothetical protein
MNVTTLPVTAPSSTMGKEEYSAVKKVPSLRQRVSLSSCTGRPVSKLCTRGQASFG